MANNHHPRNKKPTGDGNPTAGDANNNLNCSTGRRPSKAFDTLREAFALQGHALYQIDKQDDPAIYWVERWGLVRYLPTIDDARRFLDQIGGRL